MGKAQPSVAKQEDPRWDWIQRMPKVDLHRHLEGSLRLATLVEIAQEYHLELPSYNVEQLRAHVQMIGDPPGFQRFLSKFQLLRRFYVSKEVVQRITREAILDAAHDNIVYLELRFNPLALARARRFAFEDVVSWVTEATAQAQQETGTRVCLILQIPRDEPLSVAQEIVDIAIATFGPLVRGIDLAGDEVAYPPERFVEPFQRAWKAGLNITVHAGEAQGAESIRAAVSRLHAQRIGHGIRAIENSQVIQLLREHHVTLEVCPTSNLHTGVVGTWSQHPLADLLRLQVWVTLNTDDPSVSATTLSDEYMTALTRLGMTLPALYRMLRYAVEAAFIPSEESAALRSRICQALALYPGAAEAFDAAVA